MTCNILEHVFVFFLWILTTSIPKKVDKSTILNPSIRSVKFNFRWLPVRNQAEDRNNLCCSWSDVACPALSLDKNDGLTLECHCQI